MEERLARYNCFVFTAVYGHFFVIAPYAWLRCKSLDNSYQICTIAYLYYHSFYTTLRRS